MLKSYHGHIIREPDFISYTDKFPSAAIKMF